MTASAVRWLSMPGGAAPGRPRRKQAFMRNEAPPALMSSRGGGFGAGQEPGWQEPDRPGRDRGRREPPERGPGGRAPDGREPGQRGPGQRGPGQRGPGQRGPGQRGPGRREPEWGEPGWREPERRPPAWRDPGWPGEGRAAGRLPPPRDPSRRVGLIAVAAVGSIAVLLAGIWAAVHLRHGGT